MTTTQGFSGDLYDWIDPSSLPLVPYELPELPWPAEDLVLPPGVEPAVNELGQFPELLGPAGTTPLIRPDFSGYVLGDTGATSLQDYLDNHQVFGMPAGQDRLYAGFDLLQQNKGISATVNHFGGEVENETFSLVELSVACPATGEVQELIGVAISIDRWNFEYEVEPLTPRLHVEYARMVNGQLQGAWNMQTRAFRPYDVELVVSSNDVKLDARVPVGGTVKTSVPGGEQHEYRMDLFQVPTGDWWIAFNYRLIGWYPASLFSMLNSGACRAHWYTEVYDKTPLSWTTTDMGSGQFASAGKNQTTYIRNPVYRDPFWIEHVPELNILKDSTPNAPACYTRSKLFLNDPELSDHFFCGCPGGNAPNCK